MRSFLPGLGQRKYLVCSTAVNIQYFSPLMLIIMEQSSWSYSTALTPSLNRPSLPSIIPEPPVTPTPTSLLTLTPRPALTCAPHAKESYKNCICFFKMVNKEKRSNTIYPAFFLCELLFQIEVEAYVFRAVLQIINEGRRIKYHHFASPSELIHLNNDHKWLSTLPKRGNQAFLIS